MPKPNSIYTRKLKRIYSLLQDFQLLVEGDNFSKEAVGEILSRIQSLSEHFRYLSPAVDPKTERAEFHKMVGTLAHVTGQDVELNKIRLLRPAKAMLLAGYTPSQIEQAYGDDGWWYKSDWRGKQGQLPTIAAIMTTIKQATGNTEQSETITIR